MNQEKFHIERNTVRETLVIPLYSRKVCTHLYPDIFQDRKAEELINSLDYDFGLLESQSGKFLNKFGALEVGMRQKDLETEVLEYLKDHPEAAVVNMGCGLDQTGETCDNGTCRIYNLDVEEVINVRNELLPPGDRVQNIVCDLNDTAWFDSVDASKGAVFFAAGVLYYFKTEQVKALINAMAARFPGGKLVFDIGGKKTIKAMKKTILKTADMESIDTFFHVDSLDKEVRPWLENADVSSRGYMLGYNDLKSPSVPAFYRLASKVCDGTMRMAILRFDFKKN